MGECRHRKVGVETLICGLDTIAKELGFIKRREASAAAIEGDRDMSRTVGDQDLALVKVRLSGIHYTHRWSIRLASDGLEKRRTAFAIYLESKLTSNYFVANLRLAKLDTHHVKACQKRTPSSKRPRRSQLLESQAYVGYARQIVRS